MSLSQPLEALPVELQLRLIGVLPLTALIMMRGVSKHWKALIESNLEKPHVVHPTRRDLFYLWEEFISHRWFPKSRQYTLPLIKPFDREAYISKLPSSGIPLAFEMWIREWPSSAVIGWIWPGLDGKAFDDGDWCWWRSPHINRLSAEDGGPIIGSLASDGGFFGHASVDAIHILQRLHDDIDDRDVMLALNCDNKDASGHVVTTCKDSRIVGVGPWKRVDVCPDWTSYLFSYIREIDEECRDYYRNKFSNPELKMIGHEWKYVGELGEAEEDEPKDLDADEDPADRDFRETWELLEAAALFGSLGAPFDMPYREDSDDSDDADDSEGLNEWDGMDDADDMDGSEDGADGEDAEGADD